MYRYPGHHFLRLGIIVLFSAASGTVFGQAVLRPLGGSSAVRFTIRNFGINVDGSLSGISGEISFDPQRVQDARFDVSLEAATIETGNRMRDEHLRKKDYLDVARYPEIRFRSVTVNAGTGQVPYMLTGSLTIKGTTRSVKIPFRAVREGSGYRFTGELTVNRRDYGVGGSSISLSDNLTIYLDVVTR